FLASDALALAGATQRIAYLEEGDIAVIEHGGFRVMDESGAQVAREVRTVASSGPAAELGPYRHFMQKEIFEQPRAIADTLESLVGMDPDLFGNDAGKLLRDVDSVLILACGTSYHAGMVGRYWLETLSGLPCQV